MYHVEEPVTRDGPDHLSDSITTHPAFGQIGASRVQGRTNLYGSDFAHQHYIVIRMARSELHRSLSSDRHSAGKPIIEVALTESQWATFVSSMNNGSGVPCTIQREASVGMVPGLPDPKPRSDQFRAEVSEDLRNSLDALDELKGAVERMGLPKGKATELLEITRRAHKSLSDSLPYVVKRFDEHSEDTIEAAKSEIQGYMTGVIARAGLAALSATDAPLVLAAPKDD